MQHIPTVILSTEFVHFYRVIPGARFYLKRPLVTSTSNCGPVKHQKHAETSFNCAWRDTTTAQFSIVWSKDSLYRVNLMRCACSLTPWHLMKRFFSHTQGGDPNGDGTGGESVSVSENLFAAEFTDSPVIFFSIRR